MSGNNIDASTEPSNVNTTHGDMKCFPNPFVEDLNIQYNLTEKVNYVTLKVYDNQGKLVNSMEQIEQLAGLLSSPLESIGIIKRHVSYLLRVEW